MALRFGIFGSSVKIGCATKNNGINRRLKDLIWDDLIMCAHVAWARVIKLVTISAYLVEAILKGSNQT